MSAFTPRLPGSPARSRSVLACVYEVELEGFAVHTRRHFAGVLQTHTFFSREAVHAALWDLWAPDQEEERQHLALPYGGTPLWAPSVGLVQMQYSCAATAFSQDKTLRRQGALTMGTMESMPPGTRLIGAFWGQSADFPPVFEDRGFWIGKGRAAARVVRCTVRQVPVLEQRLTHHSLPVQIPREQAGEARLRTLGQQAVAEAPHYRVVRIARGSHIPHFTLDGHTVAMLDG